MPPTRPLSEMLIPLAPHAEIVWRQDADGSPYPTAPQFGDDIYSHPQNPEAEADHVFIADMPVATKRDEVIRIAELGFGTGLNFLLSWQNLRKQGEALMHYYAIEQYPLRHDDWRLYYQTLPHLTPQADLLLDILPKQGLSLGLHHFSFASAGVALSLLIGEVSQMLPLVPLGMDCWYLDGFAPAKNPAMWHEGLFAEMAKKSREGTVALSFTAAGHVREKLTHHHFQVERRTGFGRKRHRLYARFHPPRAFIAKQQRRKEYRIQQEAQAQHSISVEAQRIAIIGGGAAGLLLGKAFTDAGASVKIFEARVCGAGASGNPIALIEPRAGASQAAETHFYLSAFSHALRFFYQLTDAGIDAIAHRGIAKFPYHEQDAVRFEKAAQEFPDIWQWDGERLFCAAGLVIRPQQIIAYLRELLQSHIAEQTEITPIMVLPFISNESVIAAGNPARKAP